MTQASTNQGEVMSGEIELLADAKGKGDALCFCGHARGNHWHRRTGVENCGNCGCVKFLESDAAAKLSTPPESQGMPERPDTDCRYDSGGFMARYEEAYRSWTANKHFDLLESLLSASREEVAGLKAERDEANRLLGETVCGHVRRTDELFEKLGLSTREGIHFNERAESAEASLSAMRLELDKALSGNLQSTINVVEENVRLKQELAAMREAGEKWVSVDELLPEAMRDVLVGAEGLSVRPMFYTGFSHKNSATGQMEPLWVCCVTGQQATWPTHWRTVPALLPPQPRPDEEVKVG